MSYPITRISTTAATRARTPDAWRGLLEAYANDPTLGTLRATNFSKARVQTVATFLDGLWLAEDDVAAATAEAFDTAVTPAAAAGDGVATLAATTDTDNKGVKVQAAAGATTLPEVIRLPSDIVDDRGDVVFEARVYLDDTTVDQFFIGLAVNAAVVLASGVLGGAQSAIGFLRTNKGVLKFVSRNDNDGGTAVDYSADVLAAATLATAGWHNLCFRVNKDDTVEAYIDGTKVRKDITSGAEFNVTQTSLPEVAVVRTLAISRGAAGDLASLALPVSRFEAYVQE